VKLVVCDAAALRVLVQEVSLVPALVSVVAVWPVLATLLRLVV